MMTPKYSYTIALLAVLAMAFVGIAVTDDAAAEDETPVQTETVTTADIDVEKGVMTLTTNGLLTPDEVRTVALDLEDATYAIPLDGMATELTIATLSDYEAIKPYVTGGQFVISVAEVMEIGSSAWGALQTSLTNLGVDVSRVSTVVTVMTPVAVYQAGETAIADAVAAVTEQKDAVIAEKDAQIAVMLTQEQVDAQIAEAVAAATAGLYTQEQVDQAVTDALSKVSDYTYTEGDMTAAVDKAKADTIAQFLTADEIKVVQDSIADKAKELAKSVAMMDLTQEEADKALADYTVQAYAGAISAKAVAEKDKQIADLTEKLQNATKGEKPIYETGIGQCLIIVLVFLALLVVWFAYKQGLFLKIMPKKRLGGKE